MSGDHKQGRVPLESDKVLTYLFTLGQIRGLGPAKIKSLLSRFLDVSDVFYSDVDTLVSVKGISRDLAFQIRQSAEHLEEAEVFISKQLQIAEQLGARLIPITNADYPELLKRTSYCPEIIYALGNFSFLNKLRANCIAAGGTRKSTEYGEHLAYEFGKLFAEVNWSVISGLAKGIDAAAHRGCLDGNGYTVAVVGSGLDVVYPRDTINERNRIIECGLVLTEYPFGIHPLVVNLKKRNKIIVGLSEGLVVVQTGIKGGVYNAVKAAKEQRKPVFAVEPSVDQGHFDGNFDLISNRKAIPLTTSRSVPQIVRRIESGRSALF